MINGKILVIVLFSSMFAVIYSCKKDDTDTDTPGSNNTSGTGFAVSVTFPASTRFAQKCTLEDYTTLPCGGCVMAKTHTEAAITAYGSSVVPMEFHTGVSSGGIDGSPLKFADIDILQNTFSVPSFMPQQFLNRNILYTQNIAQIAPLITTAASAISSTVGLAISSSLNGTNLYITIKSRFAQAIKDSKLVVYILESGIVTKHANDYNTVQGNPWYNAGAPITNYINDHVVRASVSNALGDPIPNQTAIAEYNNLYNLTIPPNWNKSKLSIATMLVTSNNSLLNAQQAEVGHYQDFETMP